MGALLGIAGSLFAKVIGAHLVGPSAAVSKVESAVTGLGVRFIAGTGIGLWLGNAEFKAAIAAFVKATLAIVGV